MNSTLAALRAYALMALNFYRLRTRRQIDKDMEVLYYRTLSGKTVVLSVRTKEFDRRRFFGRRWD